MPGISAISPPTRAQRAILQPLAMLAMIRVTISGSSLLAAK